MSKMVYHVMFDNGNTITFDSDTNIDFHRIGVSKHGAGSLAFDDLFINLQHVVSISKERNEFEPEKIDNMKNCRTCKYNNEKYPECGVIVGRCTDFDKWEAKDEL